LEHGVLHVLLVHICVVMFLCIKVKPLLFLFVALSYDVALYWYMYTRLHDGAQRADALGSCSSLLTTLVMSLPALELVSDPKSSPISFYFSEH